MEGFKSDSGCSLVPVGVGGDGRRQGGGVSGTFELKVRAQADVGGVVCGG